MKGTKATSAAGTGQRQAAKQAYWPMLLISNAAELDIARDFVRVFGCCSVPDSERPHASAHRQMARSTHHVSTIDSHMDIAALIREIIREEQEKQLQAMKKLMEEQRDAIEDRVAARLEEQRLYTVDRFDGLESQIVSLTVASSNTTRSSVVSSNSQASLHSQCSANASAGVEACIPWEAPSWPSLSAPCGADEAAITDNEPRSLISTALTARVCLICKFPFKEAR